MDTHDENLLDQHRRSLASIHMLGKESAPVISIDLEIPPRPTFYLRADVTPHTPGTPRVYALVCYNNACWEIEYARLVKRDRPWLYFKGPIGAAKTAEVFALIASWAQRFLHPAEDGMEAFDRWRDSMLTDGHDISTKAYPVVDLAAWHAGGEASRLGRTHGDNPFKKPEYRAPDAEGLADMWLGGFLDATRGRSV